MATLGVSRYLGDLRDPPSALWAMCQTTPSPPHPIFLFSTPWEGRAPPDWEHWGAPARGGHWGSGRGHRDPPGVPGGTAPCPAPQAPPSLAGHAPPRCAAPSGGGRTTRSGPQEPPVRAPARPQPRGRPGPPPPRPCFGSCCPRGWCQVGQCPPSLPAAVQAAGRGGVCVRLSALLPLIFYLFLFFGWGNSGGGRKSKAGAAAMAREAARGAAGAARGGSSQR